MPLRINFAYLLTYIKNYDIKNTIMNTMIFKQNPLTNNWLCYIPETGHACIAFTKRSAITLCNNVNKAFASGELIFDASGTLVKTN